MLWAFAAGAEALFNVATLSVVQVSTPRVLLGRVIGVARVLTWSTIPLGAVAGGYPVETTGAVATVYIWIGLSVVVLSLVYSFAPRLDERPVG